MLKKVIMKPGINRENTSYYTEGGWYSCDKIRFRQGSPQKIGGWVKQSNDTYLGTCRSLWTWETLASINLIGVGTSAKFYISQGGKYYDITPIRTSVTLTNPITATVGSNYLTITAPNHGCRVGDFVTFYGATGLGGVITATLLNSEHQVIAITAVSYTIATTANATGLDTGNGGTFQAVYQIRTGADYQRPSTGWGSGTWGGGVWGTGKSTNAPIRLWSQSNYGQDLIFGDHTGGMYYWYASRGVVANTVAITIANPAVLTVSNLLSVSEGAPIQLETTGSLPTGLLPGVIYYVKNYNATTGQFNVVATAGSSTLIITSGTQSGVHTISARGVNLTTISGASDVPVVQNNIYVSDLYRFVFAFGCNDVGTTTQDPLLIRWSDQSNAAMWTTSVTNQAGSLRLTRGTQIVACQQTRQEVVVFTDSSVYVMQYLGYPLVWNAQLVGDNISIANQNAVSVASGVVYWMGKDKFYMYDGRVQTLNCDLKEYVFDDINFGQMQQVFSGTNEGFNEVWWFYCSASSTSVDKYVIYNYSENIWYYGTMARTAWCDSGILNYPIAATYLHNIVNHEDGVDDYAGTSPQAIDSYIESSEIDIDDGQRFIFIRRVLPDITFRGSSTSYVVPQATLTISPMLNSGSGYKSPASVGSTNVATVNRSAVIPVEEFTGQAFVRVRGRQFTIKVECNQIGTMWQLGAPRLDYQLDGARGT